MKDLDEQTKRPSSIREYIMEIGTMWGVIFWIWRETTTPLIRKHGRCVIVMTFVLTLASLMMPVAIKYFFDAVQFKEMKFLYYGVGLSVILLTVNQVAGYLQGRSIEWATGLNTGAIDKRITELFFEKSIGQHIQESTFLTASNIEKARGRILTVVNLLIFEAIPVVLSIVISYFALAFISLVAGAVMTFVIISYLIVAVYLNKKVFEVCTPIDRELRRINRYRYSRWDNVPWVQINTREEHEIGHTDKWFDGVIAKDRQFWIWYIKKAILRGALSKILLIAILVYGTKMGMRGEWQLGHLYMVVAWSTFIVDHLRRIGQVERNISYHVPSIRAMIDTLSIKPSICVNPKGVKIPHNTPISIRFEDVSFNYEGSKIESGIKGDSENTVLKNISFDIMPGQKVALIGVSGAGKSTIMNLLLRGNDPSSGRILISGTDLRDIDLKWWRSITGYIPQRPVVFDGTLRENLLYGLPHDVGSAFPSDELDQFAERMKVNFEGRLTDGLDTVVGRSGIKLSGGEAQRLVIAGAVLKNPRFMIIDEPTSSLDSMTESDVQQGIEDALSEGVGALIIAHRLSTVRKCDKFIVLKNSASVQNGDSQIEAVGSSFEELYENCDLFRKMAEMQHLKI